MPEVSFEQKFGQLVDAQINEKLPSLVQYRVGFQVVDKNDDETKAVGVAAFILNNVWLYIPAFFLNGDLKGLDLLYHKQQDIFIPAMDNWIKTLEEQGSQTLGFMRDDKSGLSNNDHFDAPEDTVIYEGNLELGKSASLGSGDLIDQDTYNRMRVGYGFTLPMNNVLDEIPSLGKTAAAAFVHNLANDTEYFSAFLPFYGMDDVQKTAADCAALSVSKPVEQEEDVKFFSRANMKEAASELDDASKKLLVRHGMYVKDSRTNLSKVFQIEIDSSVLQNPTCAGIYDCFMQNGEYKTMVVLVPKSLDKGNRNLIHHDSNVGRNIALIDVNKPKEYICRSNKDVFCRPATDLQSDKYSNIEGGVKASLRSLRDLKPGKKVLFVQSSKYSIETRIVGHKPDGKGGTLVTIANSTGDGTYDKGLWRQGPTDELLVEFVGKDARLGVHGDKLFVPEGTRLFVEAGHAHGTDPNPWAKPESIYQIMHKQAGLRKIDIFTQGGLTQVRSDKSGHTELLRKEAALRHLTLEHGIEGGQAVQLIKEASREDRGEKAFFIKYAAPYDTAAYGESDRPFQGGPSGNHEYAQTTSITTKKPQGLSGAKDSEDNPIMPQSVIDKALAASEAGIKEVFDTKVLQGLVEKSDVSELRKDYIVDITKGMDKIGRMLFLFYWHNDEFEEKYGKSDMQHLEDTLNEVFFSTGDLVLFLKEKTAYSPDSSESLFGTLSEGISGADGDSD